MSKNYDDIKSDARAELTKLENMFDGFGLLGYSFVKTDLVKAQIQKISANLPGELEQAKSIIKQSEITMAQANNEAEAIINGAKREKNSILQDAQMRADNMVSEDAITERAKFEAATLINEANGNIADAQTELNNYSLDVLASLKELIENYLSSVNTTIENLQGTMDARGEIEASYPEASEGGGFTRISDDYEEPAPEEADEDDEDDDEEE